MTGRPAARILDPVVHPLPGILTPGPGSPNVIIGGKLAWRGVPAAAAAAIQSAKSASDATIATAEAATAAAAGTPGLPEAEDAEQTTKAMAAASMGSMIAGVAGSADIHACVTPLPIPPHGPGVVIDGSPTVLINGLPACRQGDTIIEPVGPPDKILLGLPTVLIGDSSNVMLDESNMAEGSSAKEDSVLDGGRKDASSNASESTDKAKRQAVGRKVWPGPQHYGNCGLQSVAQMIAAKTGRIPDETELLENSINQGDAHDVLLGNWRRKLFHEQNAQSGNTNYLDRQKILGKNGVQSVAVEPNPKNLAAAIKANKGIIAAVDAGKLWNKSQYAGSGHAVFVYDADFDSNGQITQVYINDTGANHQGQAVNAADFFEAVKARGYPGNTFNVSKDPLW